jgi:hypothetical protein
LPREDSGTARGHLHEIPVTRLGTCHGPIEWLDGIH